MYLCENINKRDILGVPQVDSIAHRPRRLWYIDRFLPWELSNHYLVVLFARTHLMFWTFVFPFCYDRTAAIQEVEMCYMQWELSTNRRSGDCSPLLSNDGCVLSYICLRRLKQASNFSFSFLFSSIFLSIFLFLLLSFPLWQTLLSNREALWYIVWSVRRISSCRCRVIL